MQWDDKVERSRLRCSVSGEEIATGSWFFATLVYRDGNFVRQDFLPENWDAIEDRSVFLSWWRQFLPERRDEQRIVIDTDAIEGIFNDLRESRLRPQQCLAYILALYLTRAKRLRFIESITEDGQSLLVVEDRSSKDLLRIVDPAMDPAEVERVQADLEAIVHLDGVPDSDAPAQSGGEVSDNAD